MPPPLISDSIKGVAALLCGPGEWMTYRLSEFTIPAGRTIDSYSAFRLAIRKDPLWPRDGGTEAKRPLADPIKDGWEVAVSVTGTVVSGVPTFTFAAPTDAGERRYVLDVWATLVGGTHEVQVVRPVWLTVGPRAVAPL